MYMFYFDIKSVIGENQIFDGVTVNQHYYKKNYKTTLIQKKLQNNTITFTKFCTQEN